MTYYVSKDSTTSEGVSLLLTTHGVHDYYEKSRSLWVEAKQINVICIDQNDKESLKEADYYVEAIKKQKPNSQIIIALTKTDLVDPDLGPQVTDEDIKQFKAKHKLQDVKVIETSAEKKIGIKKLEDFIVRLKDKELIDKFKQKVDKAVQKLMGMHKDSHAEAIVAMIKLQQDIGEAAKESSKTMVSQAIKTFTETVNEEALKVEPANVRTFLTRLKEFFQKGWEAWADTAEEIEENARHKDRTVLKEKLVSYKEDIEKDRSDFKP
ncbi:Ras family [Legionella steigerwaltii]|uniref:Ras family n=1 Tax=Legionella steigerwaltii TaxID=460 RepID=A0A378L9N6_9GAMM|nr:hypothetical protein [Legionella steigerwaltii]KTD71518.1 Ras family protein [Legionella steigerwaltii]STY23546.1 Ras family [Legionella steigerwaltii]